LYNTALIKPPTYDDKVKFPFGNTTDIIVTLVEANKVAHSYTKDFSKQFRKASVNDTCKAIHDFVQDCIPYKLDKEGEQLIKSPGRLWADKAGDCKSFSLFIGSILTNLGIDFCYRFVSYSKADATPTHVYVVVPKHDIIIDSVWTGPYNTEKKFNYKKDIKMSTKIMYLGSTRSDILDGNINYGDNIGEITEGEVDLLLAKQNLYVNKKNVAQIGGTWKANNYNEPIKIIDHCLACKNDGEKIGEVGDYLIGKNKTKAGNFLKKAGEKIKKGTKAFTKVVTAPLRLATKGVLEIYLPKAAYFFLYLFVAENTLPDKMKAQRAKATKIKNFIVTKIGMKEPHFMSIVRNSLTKKFGTSPESWLATKIKSTAVIAGMDYENYIGAIGKGGGKKPKPKPKKANNPVTKARVNTQKKTATKKEIKTPFNTKPATPVTPQQMPNTQEVEAAMEKTNEQKEHRKEAGKTVITSLAKGDFIGGVIAAISWIISKLSGGKNKDLQITADDMPDVESDNANAFKYNELKENYNNITTTQKDEVKSVVTQLIADDEPIEKVKEIIMKKLPYLAPAQREEMAQEVNEGFEPTTEEDDNQTALEIKKEANNPANITTNGGGSTGWC
jgi:hypothetical protein